jgi:hypothetical protein
MPCLAARSLSTTQRTCSGGVPQWLAEVTCTHGQAGVA